MFQPLDSNKLVVHVRLPKLGKCVIVLLALSLLTMLAGCGKDEAIRHYQVPKKELVYEQNHLDSANRPPSASQPARDLIDQRMLGAIIPHGDQTWYFKMMGPDAAVSAIASEFEQLIKSVRFAEGKSTPQWRVPDGWKERQGSGQRVATLLTESEGTELELTVIPLTLPNTPEAMLANVNRWRNQLGLNPISADQFDDETTSVDLEGDTATLVNLVGKASAAGGAMSGMSPEAAPPTPRTPLPKYDTPDGWTEADPDGYSICALEFQEEDRRLRITVTPLGGMAGGVEMNVNRWREQVGLPGWTQEEAKENAEAMTIQGIAGLYIEAEGPTEKPKDAVYGWLGKEPGRMWFVKLRGDADLARRQREAFRAFLKSFKFYDTSGATNGN